MSTPTTSRIKPPLKPSTPVLDTAQSCQTPLSDSGGVGASAGASAGGAGSSLAPESFVLTPSVTRELSRLLGRNILGVHDLLLAAKTASTIRLDDVEITLPPRLLTRLKQRAIHRDFDEYVRELTIQLLSGYVGC